MSKKLFIQAMILTIILNSLLLTSCDNLTRSLIPEPATDTPEWFDIKLTDVQTGEAFTMNDFTVGVSFCQELR
jgi:hypothetical protein